MQGKTPGLHRPGRAWILACAALLCFSCRPPPSSSPPIPVEELLQRVHSASSHLRDFRGSARVETTFKGRRGRASLRIRYLYPDRFRIDVHGALFQVLAVLLIRDHEVRLYIPRENTVFEGTLETRDARIPGLDLSLEDIRVAVTGTADPGRYAALPVVDYIHGAGSAAVTLQDDGVKRTLWIDTGNMTVIREALESPGGRESVVRRFGRYLKRNRIWRPQSVRISRNDGKAGAVELTYRSQTVNRGLQPADIEVRLPERISRRPLGEAATVYETLDDGLDP